MANYAPQLTLIDGTHDAAGELPPKATESHRDPPPISARSDDKFKLGMPWPSTQIHRDTPRRRRRMGRGTRSHLKPGAA
uniref:HDC08765 n=1 Tax=Drosophila melanogaster TaxID=7227 RepID=Q6ILQ2_DROME|nr:TPA_inf: HDC08765 [Drosophila melanogaster]